MGHQEADQSVDYLRKLVVELLPDPAGEKGKTFEEPFDIRVSSTFGQKVSTFRVSLGKLPAHLAEKRQLVLVILIETQLGFSLPPKEIQALKANHQDAKSAKNR
jgi:hypothetical protein